MSAVPIFPTYMSVDDYLEFDGFQDIRYEYVGGYLYATVGASQRHNLIVTNVTRIIANRALDTGNCRVFTSAMRLRIASDVYLYPDVAVTCDFDDSADLHIENPCLIIEVLSPSTQHRDRGEKLLAYRNIDNLEAYLLVHQDEVRIERHWREGAGQWKRADIIGMDTSVHLPCPEIDLRLADIYRNLPPAPESTS